MIDESKHIKELYDLSHRHDAPASSSRFDYENKMFQRGLSSSMFKNEDTRNFLSRIEKMQVWMFESVLVARNFFNYTVEKYYNKHQN